MKSAELKVVNLNITEDFYDYKGLFRLCSDAECMDIDLVDLEKDSKIKEIRTHFELEEDIQEVKRIVKDKVMEATKIESRIVEGKHYQEECRSVKNETKANALDLS